MIEKIKETEKYFVQDVDDIRRKKIVEWVQTSKDLRVSIDVDLRETTKPGDEWESYEVVRRHFKIEGSIINRVV